MLKRLAALAALTLVPASALAQPTLPPPSPPATPTPPSSSGGGSGGGSGSAATEHGSYGPHQGWVGISLGFPAGGAPTAGFSYFLSDTGALKLDFGLDIGKKAATGKFVGGFSIEAAYRLYIAKAGNLSPFVQPGFFFSKAASDAAFGDTLAIAANFGVGAEYFFSDHLSFSGQVGLGVQFRDKFETIGVTTGTSGIFGNLYW